MFMPHCGTGVCVCVGWGGGGGGESGVEGSHSTVVARWTTDKQIERSSLHLGHDWFNHILVKGNGLGVA